MHYHHGVEPEVQCPLSHKFHPADKAPFDTSFEAAYLATVKKLNYYRLHNIECVPLWECQFDALVKNDAEFRNFTENLPYPAERLTLRAALRGGRTETFRMSYMPKKGRKLFYVDKNSVRCLTIFAYFFIYPYFLCSCIPTLRRVVSFPRVDQNG